MSQLFVCHQCDCVDMVDLAFMVGLPAIPDQQLCTMCKTGTWHGQFPHEQYDPEQDEVINRPSDVGMG